MKASGPLTGVKVIEFAGIGPGPFAGMMLAHRPVRTWANRTIMEFASSVGDSSARYTRVMSQPVVAQGRVFAMDGGVQVTALDAAGGKRFWSVDLKPKDQWRPVFGPHPADPRGIVLGAYSGHGVALSVYLGSWAAEAMLDQRNLPAWSQP